jgi:hypothetical protein
MSSDELRKTIEELKSALGIIEEGMALEKPPEEGLRDLGLAVDNVRKSVWATLSAEYADDYPSFLAKIRVRRANEICQDVLSDLYAETFAPNTSGLEVFRATLRELSRAGRGENA